MPPLSAEQLGALTRATRKAHAYLQDRVNADSLDLLRLFRHHRNEYLIRVQRIYDSFLSKEPTLLVAKGTPAWTELMRATQDMGTDLGRDLALTSVENISSMLSSQRRQVAPGLRSLFGDRVAFADQPVSVRDVAAEVTTTVSGGGTFMDRITTMTDDLKQQVWSGLRRGLVNGDDFQTVRKRMQKTFGVDKLAEPKYNAYGASKAYEWEARRVWNDVMADIADDLAEDAVPIWWATLDDRTTPGCLARHGYSVDDLGEQPPRHMNCRCEIAVLPADTDLSEARAEALSWLEGMGFSRRRALSMESMRDPALDTYESASLREANPDQARDADGKFARTGGTKRAKAKTKAKATPAPAPEPAAPIARPKSPLELAADAAGGTETPERGTGKTVFGDSDVKNEIPGWWYNPDSKRFFSVSRDAGPGDHMGLISAGDSKIGKALNLTDDEVKKLHDYYDVSYVQGKMPSDQVSEDVIGAVHSTFKKNVRVLVHKMKSGGTMYAIQTFKLDDALLSKAQEIIGKFSDGKDAAFHPKPTDEVAISNSMDDDHVYTTVSDLLSAKYLKQLRTKRTSESAAFDPAEHPRDEEGKFTRGGGGGGAAAAVEPEPLAEIPPPWRRDLPPSLTALDDTSMPSHGGHFNVGNRIDSPSYHVVDAEILGFAKGRDGETTFAVVQPAYENVTRYVTLDSVVPHPEPEPVSSDDDEDEPTPESWDELSEDQQTEAFDSWYQANFEESLRSEVDYYRENILPNDVDENMRDDHDYKRDTLIAILAGQENALHTTLVNSLDGSQFENVGKIRDAVIELDVSHDEELDLSDDEAATLPFVGGPDPRQATVEGVSHDDLVRAYRIAKWHEIKDAVARAYEKNWEKEKDKRIDEWEIDTDALTDNVTESMRDSWDNMSDRDRFQAAGEYLEELGGHVPRRIRSRARHRQPTPSPDEPMPRGKEIAVDFGKGGFAPTHESIAEKTEDLESTNLVERDGEKWKTTNIGESVRAQLEKHRSTIEELVDAYTPRHPEIDLDTSLEVGLSYGGRIDIEGIIRDRDSGDRIARFTRTLDLEEGEIKHDTFFIEEKYQGGGDGPNYKIGGLFSVATDKFYRALGLKKVKLDAVSYAGDKVTGHQMWPHQGFDWTDDYQSRQIRSAFTKAIERKYGDDSTEYKLAEKMQTKRAPAWDYSRFVDSKGEKIGFKLMHLGELQVASGDMPVPALVAMARPLAEDSAANKVWTRYAEGVTKKFQEKTEAAQTKG